MGRRRRRKRRGGGRSRREALGKARPPRGEGPRRAPLARRARGGGSARLLPRLPPRRLSSWAGGGRRLGALPAAERGEREAAFTSGPPARSEPAPLRSAPLRSAPRRSLSQHRRKGAARARLFPSAATAPARRAPPRRPRLRRRRGGGARPLPAARPRGGTAPARGRRKEPRPSRVGGSMRRPRGAERKSGGGAPVCPGGASRVRAPGRASFPAARAGAPLPAPLRLRGAPGAGGGGGARPLRAQCARGRRGGPGRRGERRHAIARQRERRGVRLKGPGAGRGAACPSGGGSARGVRAPGGFRGFFQSACCCFLGLSEVERVLSV